MTFIPGIAVPTLLTAATSSPPAVAATAVTNTPTASSSLTINLPASIAAGDLLLILVSLQANGRILTNVPTGFTRIGSVTSNSLGGEFALFRKTAAGSEGATVGMSLAGSTTGGCWSVRITGWSGTPEWSAINTLDPPNLTPSWGSANTLWLAALAIGYASQPTITFPANYTANNIQSANARAAVGWRSNTATSENPAIYSLAGGSSIDNGAATIAVQPA